MNIKNIAFALIMGCGSLLIADDVLVKNWDTAKIAISKNKKAVSVKHRNAWRMSIRDWSKGELVAKAKLENGMIVVDATAYTEKHGPVVNINGLKNLPGKAVYAEIELAANEDGKTVNFYFEGQNAKGHWWRRKVLTLTSEKKIHRIEENFPADLKNVHIRIDLKPGTVCSIGSVKYGVREVTAKKD